MEATVKSRTSKAARKAARLHSRGAEFYYLRVFHAYCEHDVEYINKDSYI